MSEAPQRATIRYAVAIAIVIIVTLVKLVFISPLVGDQQWFLLFVAAICVSSWYGGFGPGVVTAVLSSVTADFLFLSTPGAFDLIPSHLFQLLLFLVEGLLVAGLTGNLRQARADAQKSEQEKDQALALLDTFQVYAPVGLAYLDTDLRYIRINYAMAELNALTPAAHIGRTLQEVQPEIQPELVDAVRNVLETGKPLLDHELVVSKPTMLGMRKQYLMTSYYRIRGAEGEPLGVGAVMLDMTAHRQADEAIRESEARFRTMADTAPVLIWVSGADKLRTYFNKVWIDFTGRSLEQELGNGWTGGIHPEDKEHSLQAYATAFEVRESFSIEYRLRRFDGEYRWLIDQGVPRFSPDGAFIGYIGSCLDITERKQWEIGQRFVLNAGIILASSLDYETTLTNVAKLAVPTFADWCAVDLLMPDGKIDRVAVTHVDPEKVKWAYELNEHNPQTLDMEGVTQTALRTGTTQFVAEVTEDMIRASAKNDEQFKLAMSIGFTSVIVAPMIARGRTIGAMTVVTAESRRHYTPNDVNLAQLLAVRAALSVDNARLFAEARAERERFRITLSSIGDAVIATDSEGQVTFINQVARKLTGWNESDAIGKPLDMIFTIINEESRETVENPVTKVLREGHIVGLANHTVLISKTGDEIPIDDSGAPIPSEDGTIRGMVLVFRDVSERKRTERRQQFLAEASSLLMSSLNYEKTLQNITQLAVPALADWCIVHLNEEDGTTRQVALYHTDPERTALRETMMQRYVPTPTDRFSHPAVIRSGVPELIENIDAEMLRAAAHNAEHLDMLRRLQYRSSIAVPLKNADGVFGSLTLRTSQTGRALDREDLLLSEGLASIVSLAIENARLYRKAQGQ